ncbi:hypothetical protein CCOS865_02247 [Pseudomonas reidholzensis]|uniref:MobA/VirD2-like nuclease domain-containing protein n=1 Tax=Pseudomonas reidholzensis TaxID=1785162 RepID=A0A383RU55_9PSED|nr:relaxase/mobilization nuclease domain-containing protein [Pseudomonas reidholzensis]SYX89981.1 hypothetical protein CCOS865_02247 [Pseudomonas reidholzensis]
MISKIKEFSKTFRERIIYEFAAHQCDCEKIKHVEFIGGNLVSANPYYEFTEAGARKVFVDPEQIIEEFGNHTAMYKGDSDKLCAHYILSLAPGEKLTSAEWLVAVNDFMRGLGYDSSTKYVAVVHRDTDKEHVHIVASRVRLVDRDPGSKRAALGANFQLVSDSNDRHKGMGAARAIEHKYELSTPKTDGWSKELPGHSDPAKDHAHIIRGISKDVFKASNRPRTMAQLVDRLAERGVQIRVSEKNGVVQGISYRLDRLNGRWISGSTVMATKLTWSALQRNGVSYSPFRDNAKLGVGIGIAQPATQSLNNDGALFRVYVKLPKQTKELKEYVRKRSIRMNFYSGDDRISTCLGFNVGINYSFRKLKKAEVELESERKRLEDLLRQTMKVVEAMLKNLFSLFEVHVDYNSDTSDITRPALKLSVGVEDNVLVQDAEQSIHEQSLAQLQRLAACCAAEPAISELAF